MFKCRVCGNEDYKKLITLDGIYMTYFPDNNIQLPKMDVTLVKCDSCKVVQLLDTFKLDDMYRQYWYKSALNPSMVSDLKDIVESAESYVRLNNNDVVLDIGTNDGTLLTLYSNKKLRKVGFDPALNLLAEASRNCTIFVNDYYKGSLYPYEDKAKVITSIAMFYDVPDPNGFIDGVSNALDDDGIWIIQFTDLYSMLKINAIDNICPEHLFYYSLRNIVELLNNHGLQVFNVKYNNVNGGSIRVYVCKPFRYNIDDAYYKAIENEYQYFEENKDPFDKLSRNIKEYKEKVLNYIKNKKCYILGASTKGVTLTGVFGITKDMIPYALEVSKDKFYKYYASTGIKILPEKKLMEMSIPPDVLLVLPWHFKKVLIEKSMNYLIEKDGELLFPLPTPHVVRFNGKEIEEIYL